MKLLAVIVALFQASLAIRGNCDIKTGFCKLIGKSTRTSLPLMISQTSLQCGTNLKDNDTVSKTSNTPKSYAGAIALAALVVQNSALTLCMRLTRKIKTGDISNLYITSTAVVLCETLKLVTSLFFFIRITCQDNITKAIDDVITEVKVNWLDILKITIPSGLYVIQNNLQFVAVSNLPASVYQVLVQSKIATTGLFSVVLLQKHLSIAQWISIFSLTLGVAIVQLSFPMKANIPGSVNYIVGFLAVLVSCFTSGFAGVYFEKIMKAKRNTIWLRNIEMSVLSIILALFTAFTKDFDLIRKYGFFHGYNPLVMFVIVLQGLGGILVSLVVHYTNSMTKGYATSGSIILSCVLSATLLKDCSLNKQFLCGAILVCVSTLVYSLPTDYFQSLFSGSSAQRNCAQPQPPPVIAVIPNGPESVVVSSSRNTMSTVATFQDSSNIQVDVDAKTFPRS